MDDPIKITAAGNVEVPCCLALRDLGYAVSKRSNDNGCEDELWFAERDGVHLSANGPVELLGLAKLVEASGQEWRATDIEIDAFINRFYPDSSAERTG